MLLVGITVGQERNVVPVLAKEEFAIASTSVILSFLISFGFVKAFVNLIGGTLSETWGRKPLLVAGWVAALPVPLMIIWATNWWWIVGANLLMGINQGLTWSMTVTSKMDISGSKWRGLATGINEFAGYSGVAIGALVTGTIASSYGLRPAPFYFGLLVILSGLGISLVLARETRGYASAEAAKEGSSFNPGEAQEPCSKILPFRDILLITSWRDKAMFAACQAGLLHKFTDALVWVAFPLFFVARGMGVAQIGQIVASYGFSWGVLQLLTGPLTDRVGRKWPIVAGLLLCGIGVAGTTMVSDFSSWLITASLTGTGMALLYPSLLSAVGDASNPCWRGASLGVYRMWRDSGYAFGAILIGLVSDLAGLNYGFYFVALVMFISAALVVKYMYETAPSIRKVQPLWQRDERYK